MPLDSNQVRHLLNAFNFKSLFIDQLGWDHHSATNETIVNGQAYKLAAIAQKRGVVVFVHEGAIPDGPTRRRIDRSVAKSFHQHFIIFSDTRRDEQVWQWVRREPGKPLVFRQHPFHSNQSGELLIQKLNVLKCSLDEEEQLRHVDVTGRMRAAFDTDPVTKRFYEGFKSEHEKFLDFIKGIPDDGLHHWYAAVMLNRLMFIYFVQKKNFLDHDDNYLRTKLEQSKQRGKDRFYTDFLCPLFFDGFAKKESERSTATNELLGKVPYLNGGLFLRHQFEELHGISIPIGDAIFERIFAFFERFDWHLDERPNSNGGEINPDVLGYIFEKYINAIQPGERKAKGAYYTKEDITGYISQNTIIPFLFDAARQECKVAFEGDQSIWRLLQSDPDRYMYEAVKHGIILSLPSGIAVGLNDVNKRSGWNKPAPAEYALPTEIWREVIARRKRYEDVRAKLASGNIQSINDLITYNLDIRQFAQDVIDNCEGPDLLRAFWRAIQEVTVLDPTCGSGAFLFAALNILEPLYEACLNRMEVFLDELDRSGKKHRPEKFDDFRKALDRVAKHASPRSFIYKSIIVNNLYGVDIMEEAVEICKLRLFLKMVAQVDRVEQVEPLPDIDFNIRTGNTLVGYATYDAVKQAVKSKLDFENAMARIEEKAQDIDRLFRLFRQQQTELGGMVTAVAKQELRKRFMVLEEELNRYLACEYQKNSDDKSGYSSWRTSHKPFHWFIEFYRIMKGGGFDVIIGNPPYVELSQVKDYSFHGFETAVCGNLYCPMVERTLSLADMNGRFGMIVPLSLSCTERMKELRDYLAQRMAYAWLSHFSGDANPSKLFEGVKFRLNILLGKKGSDFQLWSSKYLKWFAAERPNLFTSIEFCRIEKQLWHLNRFPKIGDPLGLSIFIKLLQRSPLGFQLTESGPTIYVHRVITMFIKCFDFVPYFRNETDGVKKSEDYKPFHFGADSRSRAALAGLNSSAFFFYFVALGDCFHCGREFVLSFPLDLEALPDATGTKLEKVSLELMSDLRRNAIRRRAVSEKTGDVKYDEFWPSKSKVFLDQIDRALAKHYGFTDEELDFIINYDIKYRMGQDTEENGDS